MSNTPTSPVRRRRIRPLYFVLAALLIGLIVIWKVNHAPRLFPRAGGGGGSGGPW